MSNDAKLGARGSATAAGMDGHLGQPRRGWGIGVALLLVLGLGDACYRGDERDKDPPPGLLGGLCLAPDGHCQVGTCNRDRNYCYDPLDPCAGFFCGGEERGVCFPNADGQPSCQCNAGYNNQTFDLYCCPDPGGPFDMSCVADQSADEGGSSG